MFKRKCQILPLVGVGAIAILLAACRHPGVPESTNARSVPKTGGEPKASRTVKLEYKAQMEVTPDAQEARLWMPLPASNAHQRLSDLHVESAERQRLCADPTCANRVLCVERYGAGKGPLQVVLRATVNRQAYRVLADRAPAGLDDTGSASELGSFLRPDALVPVSGLIAAEARKAVRPGMTDLEKARAMYDYMGRTFSYDETVPGGGRGDALFACDVRRGNCSDVHSLFIGMARSVGIPARFHIGFPLPPDRTSGDVPGYHCWADFHLDGVGWVPVDISEAIQDPKRREELFGGLDADRIEFTVGRDLVFGETSALGPQNFFVYPVGIVGDKVAPVKWEFRFEDVTEPTARSDAFGYEHWGIARQICSRRFYLTQEGRRFR